MQRFYSFVSLPVITGLLIAVSLPPAQAEPGSGYYVASLSEETLAPEGTTLPAAARATHEESINPSTDLRSLPNNSQPSSSSRRAGATRGGHLTTAAALRCTGDLTNAAIAAKFAAINMSTSPDEGSNPSTTPVANLGILNSSAAIATLTWQLQPTYQFSLSHSPCE